MRKFSTSRWWQPVAVALLTLLFAWPGAAQTIPQYTFSSLSGTYAPLGAGATTFSISGGVGDADTGHSLPLPLGFAFPFAGATSTSVIVDTDGWLTPSGTANQNVFLNVLSGSQDQMIAFFGRDLHQGNATFSYASDGTAPNRVFKVQGANIGQYNQATGQPIGSGNVQVWLYESGRIEFHYGAFSLGFTTPAFTTTQVGLRGNGTSDVLALTTSWAVPAPSTSATAALPLDANNLPVNGSIFQFNPPAGADLLPPTIGPVTLTPPGGACTPSAHVVSVQPTDASGIASASVTYNVNGGAATTLPLTDNAGTWSATIPAQGAATVVYFVTVTDASPQANTATSAVDAYTDAPVTLDAGADQTITAGSTATLQATTGGNSRLKISEFTLFQTGTGATQPAPAYLGSADDLVEIANIGAGPADLSGYKFEVKGGGGRLYTFLPGTTLAPGAVLVLHLGPGTDVPTANYYHTGGIEDLGSGADVAFQLLTPAFEAIDVVAVNNFPVALLGTAWSGAGVSSPGGIAGAGRAGTDTDTNADWTTASNAARQTLGTFNPGLNSQALPAVTWTGGVLTGPVTANPLTTPAHPAPGTFTYTATYTANGCTVTDDVTVTVVTPQTPVADFSASATSVAANDVVTFTDLSTNLPASWLWSFTPNTVTFVNGTSATSQNPQVTFNGGGCYTVALTAANPAGADTETKPGYVCVQLVYCTNNANLQSSPCSSFSSPILGVVIAGTTLNNPNNGCSNVTDLSYTVFPASGATTATLTAGQTYGLTVQSASTGTIAAWLDTNADGVFAESEFILVAPFGPPPTPSTSTVMFTVPADAVGGLVTLRLRNSTSGSPTGTIAATDACVLRFTGETEDYSVTLVPGCNVPAPAPTSNSPVCAGATLQLAAGAQPTGTTYAWTGPNGFTSTAENPAVPNVTAAASGTYSLVVTVNGCASPAGTVAVTVTPVQSAAFTYSATAFCLSGANPSPTVTGAAGGTFSSTTGLTIDPLTGELDLTASAAGTYLVTYTTAGPCPGTATQTLTFTAPPAADFTYPAASVCAGSATVLPPIFAAGASTNGFTATPAGLSLNATTGEIDVAASAVGLYTVSNTAFGTGGCANVTATTTVSIDAGPTATLTAVGATTICAGDTVIVRAAPRAVTGTEIRSRAAGATSGFTYAYFLNGTLLAGATADSLIILQSGTYTVTVTDTDTGCSGTSAAVDVLVNPTQSAAFAYVNSAYCLAGNNPMPAVTGTAGGMFSSTTGLAIDAATGQLDLAASAAGTYVVTYATAGPCAATATQTLTLTPAPLAAFSYAPTTPVCAGAAGTLTPTLGAGATAGAFSATPAGLSFDAATGAIDLAASAAGTYVVTNTVTATAPCFDDAAAATVTIEAVPTADLTAAGATTFCAGDSVVLRAAPRDTINGNDGGPGGSGPSVGSYSYAYQLNGTPITGAEADSLVVRQSGTYTVTVTSVSGCSSTSAAVTVTVNPTQSAAFAFASSTLCLSGPNPTPTITGAAGGTFSSTTGLTIAAATGEIDLTASTAGTYVVTYATPGPCAGTATQTLTLTTTPLADFSYASHGPTLRRRGRYAHAHAERGRAASGTFSASPAGLAIDAATGAVDVATSTAGTYTVTNDLAASGACPGATATATLTLEEVPTVTVLAGGPTSFCAGDSVLLTADAISGLRGGPPPPPYAFQFLLNGQPIGGATGSTYYATQAGSYTVTAIATGTTCEGSSAAVAVTVNPQQSAAFTFASSTLCLSGANPTPTVTGTAGGTFSSTAGLMIDAATGEIDLTASAAGTYVVTYATAGPCAATATQSVTLTTAPLAAFSYAGAGPVCAGSTGTLAPTLGAGAAAGQFWATPAGLTINGVTGAIDVASSAPGTYSVTNTVAAAGTCPAVVDSVSLTISPAPAATLATTGPAAFCAGDSVLLTATGGTTYQFLLDGQPLSGATNDSLYATTAGNYSVTVTSTAGCSGTSTAVAVTVNPQQSAAFAYAGATFCLSSANPTPTITGAAGGTFSATPGLTVDAATGVIDLTASTAGTYTVTYATTGPCAATATQAITLTTAPLADFSYPGLGPLCAGSTATLTPLLATGASAGTFSAAPAGLSIDAVTGEVDVSASAAGTYTITNAVNASGACPAASATAAITLSAAPTVALTGLNATYCSGDPAVILTGTVDGVAGGTFSINGAPASQLGPGALGAGTYVVVITGTSAAGCSATASQTVTINATPAQPTITMATQGSGIVILTSSAPTGNQWYLNGTAIPGATSATYAVTSSAQNGQYTVVSTAGTCASATSVVQTVIVTGTTAEAAHAAHFQLYPNPTADGLVRLELPATASAQPLTVLDATGRVVYRTALPAATATHALDLRALPVGVYSVRVLTLAGPAVRRLVRE